MRGLRIKEARHTKAPFEIGLLKNGKVTNVLQVAPLLKKVIYEVLGWVPSVSQMKVQIHLLQYVLRHSLTFK